MRETSAIWTASPASRRLAARFVPASHGQASGPARSQPQPARHARAGGVWPHHAGRDRSEEHTSELQSLMRISYAVFCLKKKKKNKAPQSQSKETTQHTEQVCTSQQ